MSRLTVKICGLRLPEHVVAAAEAGADYVGFVMAPSRRRVEPDLARTLVRTAQQGRPRVRTVGVFTDASIAEVNEAARFCGFDMLQTSGLKGAGYLASLVRPVIRVLHVGRGSSAVTLLNDIERADAALHEKPPLHLLDTGGVGPGGGTGRTFDWTVARDVSRRHPVIVAGGLTQENVGELIRLVRPLGVDVSSGVEREGQKDVALIFAFIEAVRKAEQEIDHAEDASG